MKQFYLKNRSRKHRKHWRQFNACSCNFLNNYIVCNISELHSILTLFICFLRLFLITSIMSFEERVIERISGISSRHVIEIHGIQTFYVVFKIFSRSQPFKYKISHPIIIKLGNDIRRHLCQMQHFLVKR